MRATGNYRTDIKPVWCPGCGNYGLLAALTRQVLPELGIPEHNTFIASGIGCSSRVPAYINTYGLNSIHGRAIPIAQGAKLANPDLTVLAIGGDGDFFSIGTAHLPHAVRRNIDITCIMLNNFVYALTKGQISPTTPHMAPGKSPFLTHESYPPVDPMLEMVSYSRTTEASFIAQGIATDVPHLSWLIKEGIKHRGFSFISVLSLCVTFNPTGLFDTLRKNASYLKEGEEIKIPDSLQQESLIHKPGDMHSALRLASIPLLGKPLLGIFFQGKERSV
jgi:2-oxoglutarate ferredoxin oxidoreductase subunit beta